MKNIAVHRWMPGALAAALCFSSCTCQREAPPQLGALPTRAPGFQATVSTPAASPRAAALPTGSPTVARLTLETPTAPVGPTPAGELTLPDNFPRDVPVYAGANLITVQRMGGEGRNVLFGSSAPAPEIYRFYEKELKANGYELTQQYETQTQSFLSFKKGQLITNIVIAQDPNDPKRQVIAIMYHTEEPAEEF